MSSNMTVADIRKLAIECQLKRETQDEATKCYYAWMNDSLNQRFNQGRAAFVKKLNQLTTRMPIIRDTWAHVGKNH